jgi:hypothetical protein
MVSWKGISGERRMSLLTVLVTSFLAAGQADGSPARAVEERFFETTIRPILVEHCQSCHGEQKQWNGFRLDSREAVLKGGDLGPAVVPGKPGESRLIKAVRHVDDELQMPPDGKLTELQIADLVRWVEMGVPFPAGSESAAKRSRDPNHWAFQPPGEVALPAMQQRASIQSPMDTFIEAKLEAAGLASAEQADRRTLIRRLTFDLVGLPPTPEEVHAFLSDESPDAIERLVDRLLGSPHYGERWGRHWLDVARYADSNGLDENVAHGNAWRYRDYVVTSFNRDKPYDRFVVEQVAGDLLATVDEAQRHERLIATGFLAIGPKVLAEVDEAKMQMDIVDEQIDTFGRAFLGLTLGCARCHDHKFDPIDTADYYGLAGIFKSSRVMEHYKKVAKWHENVLTSPETEATLSRYKDQVAAQKNAIENFVAAADEEVRERLSPGASVPEKLEPMYPAETKAELKKLRDALAALEKNPPELPSAMGAKEDTVEDEAIRVRGNPLKLGVVVPRHVPPVLKGPLQPEFTRGESGRRELAAWLVAPNHPLTARVTVNRIWRWHFGAGLVRTTDNFGLLGEAPTHPELLDWLARRFVADGWSLKKLHRLILASHVYRQGSQPSAKALAVDAENRLWSHFAVRRLEAEELRDTLLAVADQLDTTMGASLLKVKNRGYFFDHTSKDLTDYASRRRSLYLPVVRNNVYDVFQLLDFPDPATASSDRSTTTIAPQALLMLNSELVMQAAENLAERSLAEAAHDKQRVKRIYEIAYGRAAQPTEISAATAFLERAESSLDSADVADGRRQAWTALCHTILAANEFVYVK